VDEGDVLHRFPPCASEDHWQMSVIASQIVAWIHTTPRILLSPNASGPQLHIFHICRYPGKPEYGPVDTEARPSPRRALILSTP
jgi:hypothetical protein